MINKLQKIIKSVAGIMDSILGGFADGMIYGNTVVCNGGGVVIEEALH